jgi:hypothetical protein
VKKITYIGTIGGGVEIDGGVVVETGDTVDVDDELADRLLEQEGQFVLAAKAKRGKTGDADGIADSTQEAAS